MHPPVRVSHPTTALASRSDEAAAGRDIAALYFESVTQVRHVLIACDGSGGPHHSMLHACLVATSISGMLSPVGVQISPFSSYSHTNLAGYSQLTGQPRSNISYFVFNGAGVRCRGPCLGCHQASRRC